MPGTETKENRAGKLAEAGGKAVINSIIPFRSLLREVTGAAPADRRLNAALDASYARRASCAASTPIGAAGRSSRPLLVPGDS